MEVLDQIYHQFFFTTNSLGSQPMTSQYFQLINPLTVGLAAAALRCVLSEYASGKKVTVMSSEHQYWGTFFPSRVMNWTPEAAALHTFVGRLIPPPKRNSSRIVTPWFPTALLCWNRHSPIPSFWIGAPVCKSALYTPFPRCLSLGASQFPSAHLSVDFHSSIEFRTLCSASGTPQLLSAFINPHWHSSA